MASPLHGGLLSQVASASVSADALQAQCSAARAQRLAAPGGTDKLLPACENVISFELRASCTLPEVEGRYSPAWRRVESWLRLRQNLIVSAEEKWGVDRRAIAGAIAWEALQNVRDSHFWSRATGPGKFHYKLQVWESGPLLAREVEEAGYLSVKTDAARKAVLSTDSGAIEYIAAAMRALADIVAARGYPPRDTYWNPVNLTNWYQGETLSKLKARYEKRRYPDPLVPGNSMALWVQANIGFIEDAVGVLPPECRGPLPVIKGVKLPVPPKDQKEKEAPRR